MWGFWENVWQFIPHLHFFFFKVEISSIKPIPLFRKGSVHSGSVSWELWPSVSWRVACQLVSWQIPTLCLDSGIVSPLQLRWVKGVCMFRCNLQPAFLAQWPGSFTCHCSNMGVEQTLNKSQHTKLTLEKKILLPLLLGFKLPTFQSWVCRSNQPAITTRTSTTANLVFDLLHGITPHDLGQGLIQGLLDATAVGIPQPPFPPILHTVGVKCDECQQSKQI